MIVKLSYISLKATKKLTFHLFIPFIIFLNTSKSSSLCNQKRLKRKEFNNEQRKHYRREISLGPSLYDSHWVTGSRFMTILFRHLRNTLRASLQQKAPSATYNGGENSGDGSLRPVSKVVLLPCRTQLIELNSTLARQ